MIKAAKLRKIIKTILIVMLVLCIFVVLIGAIIAVKKHNTETKVTDLPLKNAGDFGYHDFRSSRDLKYFDNDIEAWSYDGEAVKAQKIFEISQNSRSYITYIERNKFLKIYYLSEVGYYKAADGQYSQPYSTSARMLYKNIYNYSKDGAKFVYTEGEYAAQSFIQSYGQINITVPVVGEAGFYYGISRDPIIKQMSALGEKPKVIDFMFEDEKYYFWYYEGETEFSETISQYLEKPDYRIHNIDEQTLTYGQWVDILEITF